MQNSDDGRRITVIQNFSYLSPNNKIKKIFNKIYYSRTTIKL